MTIMERCGGEDEVEEVTACPVPKTWDLKWGLMEKRYHFLNGKSAERHCIRDKLNIATILAHLVCFARQTKKMCSELTYYFLVTKTLRSQSHYLKFNFNFNLFNSL